jgi:hypothetical protein
MSGHEVRRPIGASREVSMKSNHASRKAWLRLASVLLLVAISLASPAGCGPAGSGGDNPTVKDPPPLPREETTEEFMKQQAQAKAKTRTPARAVPGR